MISSQHSTRLRRFILDSRLDENYERSSEREMLWEIGRDDMSEAVEYLKDNPDHTDLQWVKVEAGDYRATFDNIEVRAVAYCMNLRLRPEWAIESRFVVSDNHRRTYGPTLWQPSSLDGCQMWPTMRAAQEWAASALVSGLIEPNGSRGFLSPDGHMMGV